MPCYAASHYRNCSRLNNYEQLLAKALVQQQGSVLALVQSVAQSMVEVELVGPALKVAVQLVLPWVAKDSQAQWTFLSLHALHDEESSAQHSG